jgi:hypothetical protein
MDQKKISSINQKENHMNSTHDLKLKITKLFAQLNPKNRDGFLNNMKEYDMYSKVALSEEKEQQAGAQPPMDATSASAEASSTMQNSNAESEATLDLDELAELEMFATANQDFLEEELGRKEQQLVQLVARSEGETIYRKDEIVSELFDEFRQSGASTIFSNEDKLNLWIHEMLDLVEKVSTKDEEGRITGFRHVSATDKPVIDNFHAGHGTGVSWVVPVSEERKKIYNAGNDGEYFFSADPDVEIKREDKIIAANPSDLDPETKYKGYDIQERALYELSKPYANDEEIKDGNDGTLQKSKDVYYQTDSDVHGSYTFGKRVIEKGVQRVENVYENVGKKKRTEPKKEFETLGRKRLVGVEEVQIVKPDLLKINQFVLTKPSGRKLKTIDGFYHSQSVDPKEQSTVEPAPFRRVNLDYALISARPCTRDPYALERPLSVLNIDEKTYSVSNLKKGDKVLLRFSIFSKEVVITTGLDFTKMDPIDLEMIATVLEVSIPKQLENGKFEYGDGTQSNNPYCQLIIIPMALPKYFQSVSAMSDEAITMVHPRVVDMISYDYESVAVGDTIYLLFTDTFYDKYVHSQKTEFLQDKNPYFVTKTKNYLVDDGDQHESPTPVKGEVVSIDFESVTIKVEQLTMTISKDDFMLVYFSKNSLRFGAMLDHFNANVEHVNHELNYKDTLFPDIENGDASIWTVIRKKVDDGYVVQLLQPSSDHNFSDTVFVPKDRIQYTVQKTVFERKMISTTMGSWITGVIQKHDLGNVIPTVQTFLNRISKHLYAKESIHYGFIQDIAKLALDYERYEITDTAKKMMNAWMEWNIVKHVESLAINHLQVRQNYIDMLKQFESGTELNPNKFRLDLLVDPQLTNCSDWKADQTDYAYDGISNVDLVLEIKKDHTSNNEIWNAVNRKQLSAYQMRRLHERPPVPEPKWNKVLFYKELAKPRQAKVLDAIGMIRDLPLRNQLLRQFIEQNCYLTTDEKTGTSWYVSKGDMTLTPLLCPHLYLEAKSEPLTQFSSEALKDGSVICKNCGKILNTITFSYFEGYDDEDKIRERVTISNTGKEVIGTMPDIEIVIQNHTLYSEDQPELFRIETVWKHYLSFLPPAAKLTRELTIEAIDDIQAFMVQNNVNDFESWFESKKALFMKGLRTKAEYAKLKDDDLIKLLRKDKSMDGRFKKFLEDKVATLVIARLAILFEKQVGKAHGDQTINNLIKSNEESRVRTGEKPTDLRVIENVRKEALSDFENMKRLPKITTLYHSASEYENEEAKALQDEKFLAYTEADLNDELSLDDAIHWLRYYIRNSHRQQKVLAEVSVEECVPGTNLDSKSYGTDAQQGAMVERLEQYVRSKLPSDDHRTGVKTRKQFYSDIEILDPILDDADAHVLEAKMIVKNIYGLETNPQILKAMYDKSQLQEKKQELRGYLEEVLSNLDKYRNIDYLMTYVEDPLTDVVGKRMFENPEERTQLISIYIAKSEAELAKEATELRKKEITIQTFSISEPDVCTKKPKEESTIRVVIDKIGEVLREFIVDGEAEIRETLSLLTNLEKEFIMDGRNKISAIQKATVRKEQITVHYREYERLTKMLNFLKRDYNYLVHGVDLKQKRLKLGEQTGQQETELFTDYDYLIPLQDLPIYSELKDQIHSLAAKEVQPVELLICDAKDEIEKLSLRNTRNKFLFCITLLKILLQNTYDWDNFKVEKESSIVAINVKSEDLDETTVQINRELAHFTMGLIGTINTVLRREEETLLGVESYKERNYALVKLVERTRRMKHVDEIGSDLMKEFNKVMKGKRVLEVKSKEIASDGALESAKQVEQDRYDANPNGQGNYGTLFDGDIEGEHDDDGHEEQAYDRLDE